MNAVRLWIVAIIGTALIGGGVMYYQLVYAGYAELTAAEVGELQLQSVVDGQLQPILSQNVKAIDTVEDGVRLSGAISFRACFETTSSIAMLSETYVIKDNATPLTAPSWFDCFDARAIGAALETGEAVAFASTDNISYGVDRVIAVMPDGKAYVWHQLNACGDAVFAGDATPDGCPNIEDTTGEDS